MSRREGHTSNQVAQSRLREQQKFLEEQRRRDLKAVMAGPEGRRFMWHLLGARCFLWARIPTGAEGLRYEGRRDVAAELRQELRDYDLDAYLLMERENGEAEREARLHKQAAESANHAERDE